MKVLAVSFFIIALVSCHKTQSQEVTILKMHQKVDSILTYSLGSPDRDFQLQIALNYLDTIVFLGSTSYASYSSKATILSELKNYNELINVLEKMNNLKQDNFDLMVFKGIVYDRLKDSENSNKSYGEALEAVDKKILLTNDLNLKKKLLQDKVFLYCFMERKDLAIDILSKMTSVFNDRTEISALKDSVLNFDKTNNISAILK